MSERAAIAVPAAIQEAQQQFENWRGQRQRGERIPESLWTTVVELAKQRGVADSAGVASGPQPFEAAGWEW